MPFTQSQNNSFCPGARGKEVVKFDPSVKLTGKAEAYLLSLLLGFSSLPSLSSLLQ